MNDVLYLIVHLNSTIYFTGFEVHFFFFSFFVFNYLFSPYIMLIPFYMSPYRSKLSVNKNDKFTNKDKESLSKKKPRLKWKMNQIIEGSFRIDWTVGPIDFPTSTILFIGIIFLLFCLESY